MRILISAYACEPGKSSEPAVEVELGPAKPGATVYLASITGKRKASILPTYTTKQFRQTFRGSFDGFGPKTS